MEVRRTPGLDKRTQVAILVATVVGLLLAVGSTLTVITVANKDADSRGVPIPPVPHNSWWGPPSPQPIPAGDGAALMARLLPMPANAQLPRGVSSGGVMDIDQFAATFPGAAAQKQVLQSQGFLVGAHRDWIAADLNEADIQLLQFATDAGATRFLFEQRKSYTDDPTMKSDYQLSAGAGAEGFELATSDRDLPEAVLFAVDGNTAIVMRFYVRSQYNRTAETALMQQQMTALSKP